MSLIEELKNCSGEDLMLIRNLFEFAKITESVSKLLKNNFLNSFSFVKKEEIPIYSNTSTGESHSITSDFIWKYSSPEKSWEFDCRAENIFNCLKSNYLGNNGHLSLDERFKAQIEYNHLMQIIKQIYLYEFRNKH